MHAPLTNVQALAAVAMIALITYGIRALPFLIFGRNNREVPPIVAYLGKVLPYASMVLLVIYCLRNVSLTTPASIVPTAAGVSAVVLLQLWKKNSVLSVFLGTAVYMFCLHLF